MSRALVLTQRLTRLFSAEELRLHVAAEPDAETLTTIRTRPHAPGEKDSPWVEPHAGYALKREAKTP